MIELSTPLNHAELAQIELEEYIDRQAQAIACEAPEGYSIKTTPTFLGTHNEVWDLEAQICIGTTGTISTGDYWVNSRVASTSQTFERMDDAVRFMVREWERAIACVAGGAA